MVLLVSWQQDLCYSGYRPADRDVSSDSFRLELIALTSNKNVSAGVRAQLSDICLLSIPRNLKFLYVFGLSPPE
jgi:hypothetical protein